MPAKKKKPVKPANRGFATTSIASTKKIAEPEPEPDEELPEPAEAAADVSHADESVEYSLEDAETHQLNLLAAKVKPAAAKEISRLHKVALLIC
jgi:hypothetical protein